MPMVRRVGKVVGGHEAGGGNQYCEMPHFDDRVSYEQYRSREGT